MAWLDIFRRRAAPAAPPRTDLRQAAAVAAGQRRALRLQGFAGGVVDRLTSSLQAWSGAVNADLDNSLVILRARARALAANNEHGRRFLSLVASNVVGPAGTTLQVRARQSDGKTLDKIANDIIEIAWAKWSVECDVTGRCDFAHVSRLVIKAVARDGECLVRILRGQAYPNGLQLQVLESDRLDESMNLVLNSGNTVRMGVEVDAMNRPVAYYVRVRHPGDRFQNPAPMVERVSARDMLHIFLPERAEQVRGYTWFHAVIRRLSMLGDFEEAAVVAAQVGAKKMGVFTRTDEEVAPPVGTGLASVADGQNSDGSLVMNAEAGEFMELPPGYGLESWDPQYPHENFASFMTECKHGIAAGLDVATHNLTGNMAGVNYSSARIAELSERDMWMMLQAWFAGAFVCKVYREWLAMALLRGEIQFPNGKSLPRDKFSKFYDASTFQGRRWQWVDLRNEMDAAAKKIELGLDSRTNIAATQGRDFDDILREREQEEAEAALAGVSLGVAQPAAQPTTPTEPKP